MISGLEELRVLLSKSGMQRTKCSKTSTQWKSENTFANHCVTGVLLVPELQGAVCNL